MSKQVLDRNRKHGIVYGDPVQKFYQDGVFFNGLGEAVDTAVKAPRPPASEPPIPVVESKPDSGRAAMHAKLKDMHIAKLKKLAVKVQDATGVPAPELKGAGVKARVIAYLLDNTDE
jgi:hypothetical protein